MLDTKEARRLRSELVYAVVYVVIGVLTCLALRKETPQVIVSQSCNYLHMSHYWEVYS